MSRKPMVIVKNKLVFGFVALALVLASNVQFSSADDSDGYDSSTIMSDGEETAPPMPIAPDEGMGDYTDSED